MPPLSTVVLLDRAAGRDRLGAAAADDGADRRPAAPDVLLAAVFRTVPLCAQNAAADGLGAAAV